MRASLDGKVRHSLDFDRESVQSSILYFSSKSSNGGDHESFAVRPSRPSSVPVPIRPTRPNRNGRDRDTTSTPPPSAAANKRNSVQSITGTFASISSASTSAAPSIATASSTASSTSMSSSNSTLHSASNSVSTTRSRSRSASSPLPADAPTTLTRPLVLHPDFRGDGDVVLVCSDGGDQLGFRVTGNMLRMASPILAALLKDKKGSTSFPHFVKVTDLPEDMHAFLRLLRFGTPGGSGSASSPASPENGAAPAAALSPASATTLASPSSPASTSVPPDFFPSISQYDGINRLTLKYNGWYPRAVLDFHVELRAAEIVDRVGRAGSKEDVYALVRLAHNLHSSFLWAEICERLRTAWWHDLLNPWKFGDSDVEILGDSIFSLLSILASVSSRPKLFSHLDELCVLYSEEGDVSVAATERRSMQQGCTCGAPFR